MYDTYEQAYATSKKGGGSKKGSSGNCHLGGQPGHWKREGPLRRSLGQSKGTSTSSMTSTTSPARAGLPALLAIAEQPETQRTLYEEVPGTYHTTEESPLVLGRELPGEKCDPPNMLVSMMSSEERDQVRDMEHESATPKRNDQEQVIQLTGSIDLGCLDMMGELRVREGVGHVILRPVSGGATATMMKLPMAQSWTAVSTPSSSRVTTEPSKHSGTMEQRQLVQVSRWTWEVYLVQQ
eukprot:656414-Amphidinium_carterae.3